MKGLSENSTAAPLTAEENESGLFRYRCLVCDEESLVKVRAKMGAHSSAVMCPHCSVKAVRPWPSIKETIDFYQNYGNEFMEIGTLFQEYTTLIEYLETYGGTTKRPLSFFDFGCGPARFLRRARQMGHVAVGAEFSDFNIRQLKDLGIDSIDLRKQSLQSMNGQSFDRITLLQVVEHLLTPQETLKELASLLAPEGILYLECPNDAGAMYTVKRLVRNFFHRGHSYGSLLPPHHVHGFNRRSLTRLLEKCGYEVVEIADYPMGDMLRQVESRGFFPTIFEIITNRKKWKIEFVAKCAIRLLDPIASRFGLGGGLYAVARRKR